MSRPKNPIPRYLLHKSSGQARVVLNGRDVYLGVHGSQESFAAYAKLVAELKVSHGPQPGTSRTFADLTVDEVLLAFWRHAQQHYRRPDGTATSEVSEYRQTFKVIRALYATTLAKNFGPLALKAIRERMVELGWCRGLINARVNRVRRMFKWAASEELVHAEVYNSLVTVTGLQQNRSKAREAEPVQPVAVEHVIAVLPYLPRPIRGMVELQLICGMRPGEVCAIRPDEIDMTGDIWYFKPTCHKLRHKGKPRTVALGPRSQAILKKFMPADPVEYFFSPRVAVAEFRATRNRERKTPRYASHMARNVSRRVANPKRQPSAKYTTGSYGKAIEKGIDKANRSLLEAGVETDLHVPHWAPNMLRHAHATAVRKRFGLEAAQVVLGHERADVTQVYAEKNLALATTVAAAMS